MKHARAEDLTDDLTEDLADEKFSEIVRDDLLDDTHPGMLVQRLFAHCSHASQSLLTTHGTTMIDRDEADDRTDEERSDVGRADEVRTEEASEDRTEELRCDDARDERLDGSESSEKLRLEEERLDDDLLETELFVWQPPVHVSPEQLGAVHFPSSLYTHRICASLAQSASTLQSVPN